jgi:hypothetical protein
MLLQLCMAPAEHTQTRLHPPLPRKRRLQDTAGSRIYPRRLCEVSMCFCNIGSDTSTDRHVHRTDNQDLRRAIIFLHANFGYYARRFCARGISSVARLQPIPPIACSSIDGPEVHRVPMFVVWTLPTYMYPMVSLNNAEGSHAIVPVSLIGLWRGN